MHIQHETIIYKAIHGQTYNLNCLTICIQLNGRRLNLTDKDQLVDTERTRMLNVYAHKQRHLFFSAACLRTMFRSVVN